MYPQAYFWTTAKHAFLYGLDVNLWETRLFRRDPGHSHASAPRIVSVNPPKHRGAVRGMVEELMTARCRYRKQDGLSTRLPIAFVFEGQTL